ncbi:MAG: hypothetical protein H0W53_21030 [Acidobacteria bacterium]|nr:hypothetical protein [Acidobacteriota bacterium]
MFVVHGTRKFLDRADATAAAPSGSSTTKLGSRYATVLFWKPQIALFFNETTLLPVLIPLAPAASVIDRFPPALALTLDAHRINRSFIDREVAEMTEHRLAKTVNRSAVGVMTEFAHLGAAYQSTHDVQDVVALSLRLAGTPCGPLYRRHVSPDRELAAFTTQHPNDHPAD